MPLGIAVAGANRHDVTLVAATVASIPIDRPAAEEEHPQGMCMDKAYDDPAPRLDAVFAYVLRFLATASDVRGEAEPCDSGSFTQPTST